MSYPYNLVVPNYAEKPLLSSWEGYYWKPSLGYNTMSFGGSGGRLRDADGITLGALGRFTTSATMTSFSDPLRI